SRSPAPTASAASSRDRRPAAPSWPPGSTLAGRALVVAASRADTAAAILAAERMDAHTAALAGEATLAAAGTP
ncbi:hypothetical protein ACWCPG_16250, partial [Streptomyces sp. NPDC001919]